MLYIPWPFKRCTSCGRDLPATTAYFNRGTRCKGGLYNSCRECRARYRNDNADKIREQKHQEYLRHIDKYTAYARTKGREQCRRYYAANREAQIARTIEYQHAHPEVKSAADARYSKRHRDKHNAHGKLWRQRHPDRARAYVRNRRARRKRAEGRHTVEDVQRQYKAQRGKCYYCGCKVGKKYHVDHVIPLSRGGTNGPENIVITCPSCNLSKNDKLPHEWDGNNGRLL